MPYEFQPYPSVRYHRDGREQLIHSDEQHEALHAEGWRDTPAAFTNEPPAEDVIAPSVQLEALQIAAKKRKK